MTSDKNAKTVLITGGSRGIGLAIVQKFKKEGWIVATCATQKENLKDNPADFPFVCDVSSVEEVKKGIAQVIQSLGRSGGKIDVLINNAGLTGNTSMDVHDSDDFWHRIIDVNLNGTYYFCKYAGPHLTDSTGKIINVASVLALKGVPDAIAYSTAKHGVLGLTRSLAHYFAPRRITVNAICPGWVRTDMALGRLKDIGLSEKDLGTAVPLGRFVEPQEIADFIYSITALPGASMMTGQALTLDGGFLA